MYILEDSALIINFKDKKMHKVLFISILLLTSFCLSAQDVVFENEVKDYSQLDENGPNLKKFSHTYVTYGLNLGENIAGAKIHYGSSGFYEFGFRHKRKFSKVFSGGYGVSGRFSSFKLVQEAGKILPDASINKKETLSFYSIGGELYFRINFSKKRGNLIGLYMDLGGRADYNYHMLLQRKNKVGSVTFKSNSYGYDFDIPYNFGPLFRFGYNQFALTANYRYSDFFKSSANLPELPRLMLGIEISTFD